MTGGAMQDEPLYAGAGIAVSTARIISVSGTLAVASVSQVRVTYSHGGRAATFILVPVGVAIASYGVWANELAFGGALGGISVVVGMLCLAVRPTGFLYVTSGDRERLVARGDPSEIAKAGAAIERAIASRG